jgi:hypothetical protein
MSASVRALRCFMHDGKRIAPGERIVCEDALACELVTAGRAEFADDATRERFVRRDVATWQPAGADRAAMPGTGPTLREWIACAIPRARNWMRRYT